MYFPRLSTPPPAPSDRSAADHVRQRLLLAALGLLVVGAGVYAAVLHHQLVKLRDDSSRTIEAHLRTIALRTEQVEALDVLASRVDAFNREFGARLGRVQVDNLEGNIKALEQKGHLPDDAKKTLDEFEKSAAEIDDMTTRMKEFERYLGAPIVVKHGESHAQIAQRYLVDQAKLTAKQAEEVVRRTALDWELEPGNQVFNLYQDGILLSTVTQGTAKRAPMLVQLARRHAQQVRTQELEQKVNELEARLGESPTEATTAPRSPDPGAPPPGGFWIRRTDGQTTVVDGPGGSSRTAKHQPAGRGPARQTP